MYDILILYKNKRFLLASAPRILIFSENVFNFLFATRAHKIRLYTLKSTCKIIDLRKNKIAAYKVGILHTAVFVGIR